MKNDVIVIAGPTASGKSCLAVKLATRLNGIVINADSIQQYNALPILTSQPSVEMTDAVPHKLYGFLDPYHPTTAMGWVARAIPEIEQAQIQGNVPILVGGTGLYLEALMQGMAAIHQYPKRSDF